MKYKVSKEQAERWELSVKRMLIVHRAKDLSNEELQRTMGNCVCAGLLIGCAVYLRDNKYLNYSQIEDEIKKGLLFDRSERAFSDSNEFKSERLLIAINELQLLGDEVREMVNFLENWTTRMSLFYKGMRQENTSFGDIENFTSVMESYVNRLSIIEKFIDSKKGINIHKK